MISAKTFVDRCFYLFCDFDGVFFFSSSSRVSVSFFPTEGRFQILIDFDDFC